LVDPSINRVSRGGVDPIPFVFLLSLPSLSPSCYNDLVTVVLPRLLAQLPPPARLVLAPPLCVVFLRCMRVKFLCHIRSSTNPSSEMAAEAACLPDLQAAWVRSTMTEAKIQALVDQGLLWSKTELEWRAAAGEEFPSEDVKEQVVFASFFERGFNLPAGDFFRGLLYYYRLELVHLVPNSITVVSTFIHFCEAYLGIPLHFLL
jgi:hypothetical protein